MKYSIEVPKAEIGKDGFSKNKGWITTYMSKSEPPYEYFGAKMELLFEGISVGQYSYIDAPEIPNNDEIAIVRSEDREKWIHIPDHRGKTIFNTTTRYPYTVDYPGEIKTGFTFLAPKTKFDKWDGEKWVTDNDALKADQINTANQIKLELIDEAESKITFLDRKVRLGMANNSEKTALRAWEMYSIKLNDIDTLTAPTINWPEKPV